MRFFEKLVVAYFFLGHPVYTRAWTPERELETLIIKEHSVLSAAIAYILHRLHNIMEGRKTHHVEWN